MPYMEFYLYILAKLPSLIIGFGFVIAFGYRAALCTKVKLGIVFGTLIIGLICYLVAEWIHKREASEKDISVQDKKESTSL